MGRKKYVMRLDFFTTVCNKSEITILADTDPRKAKIIYIIQTVAHVVKVLALFEWREKAGNGDKMSHVHYNNLNLQQCHLVLDWFKVCLLSRFSSFYDVIFIQIIN